MMSSDDRISLQHIRLVSRDLNEIDTHANN